MQERRHAPRILERVELAVTDGGGQLRAETQNLSIAGAYCLMDRFLPPMTKLALDMELPTAPRPSRVRCTGVVVRAEPVVADAEHGKYHIAIFFTDLSDRDRAAITEFVRQRIAARSAH